MDKSEMNRRLAEVMGWHYYESDDGTPHWLDKDNRLMVNTWNPAEDANQMLMVMKELANDDWELTFAMDKNRAWCHLGRNKSDDWRKAELIQGHGADLLEAIGNAILKAVGDN